jgi:hypothetical protein
MAGASNSRSGVVRRALVTGMYSNKIVVILASAIREHHIQVVSDLAQVTVEYCIETLAEELDNRQ